MNDFKTIFFFDLDGTLLTDDKTISAATRTALLEYVLDGNHVAVCTGRGLDNVIDVSGKLGLDFPGTYLICFNGGIIYECDTKKVISRIGIPLKYIPGLFELASEHSIHCHTYASDHMITPDEGEEMKYYNRIIQRPLVVTQDIAGNLTEDPCKVIAIELHDADKLECFKQAVDEKYGDVFTTCYSNPYYLEIYMKESGKGSAVKRLAEYLDVPISNTYAAGDEMNDISMIEAAGCGIAMINASDEVKAHADVITKTDNNRDGLAELIRSAI